jgi:hypothetical protein
MLACGGSGTWNMNLYDVPVPLFAVLKATVKRAVDAVMLVARIEVVLVM